MPTSRRNAQGTRKTTRSPGGRRAGAGRKPKSVVAVRSEQIRAVDLSLCKQVTEYVDLMGRLARGGIECVEEEFQPAGCVTVGNGASPRRVFPDLAPEHLVLTRRKVSCTLPDRAALTDLLNRIIGRPREAPELKDEVRATLPDFLAGALKRAYGDKPTAPTST